MAPRKPALKKRKKPEDDHPFGTDSEPEDKSADQAQPTHALPRKPPKQPIYPDPSSIKTRLRTGNNPHPTNSAGIYKRTKADINTQMAAKNAVKDACMKEIEGRLARAKEMQAAAIRSLADLEDKQAQDDLEEASYDSWPQTPNHSDEELELPGSEAESEVDDNPTEAKSGGKAKKPTARERRKTRAEEVRNEITQARKIPASAKHDSAATNLHRADTNPVKRAKISKDDKEDFDHEWWNFIRNRTAKKALTKSMGGLSIRDSTPSPREKEGSMSTLSWRQTSAQENRDELSTEGGPGFTDNDVTSSRPSPSEPFRAGRSTQLKSNKDALESESLPLSGRGRSQAANATRRSDVGIAAVIRVKSEGNVGESRSQGSLPTWIHGIYKEELLPTLVTYFGAESDPWELGGKDGKLFSSILKKIVGELCPSQHYEPVRSGADTLYTVSRQAILDLRRKFQATAITLVRKEVKSRQD
ncbi:hypothetical protein EWM64_g5905 [Hericium alpestre]|uniref:Uncharacterized protein n=1 Tax=Hericium alpestre TaxID=135208 RepID=A0A4Y9ZVL8_9AGAM|nr:hypothetical protein EWM64_g5905 [Hericium alpestre]